MGNVQSFCCILSWGTYSLSVVLCHGKHAICPFRSAVGSVTIRPMYSGVWNTQSVHCLLAHQLLPYNTAYTTIATPPAHICRHTCSCMEEHAHTCMHTYTHAHTRTHAHTHTHTRTHTCTQRIHTREHKHTHTDARALCLTHTPATYTLHSLSLSQTHTDTNTHTPVSYTHLTLPTKLSV